LLFSRIHQKYLPTFHTFTLFTQSKASFAWSGQHETEFQDFKSSLLSKDIILYHPDWDGDFQFHTDASKVGCGAMHAQKYNGYLWPVAPSKSIYAHQIMLAYSTPRTFCRQMGS